MNPSHVPFKSGDWPPESGGNNVLLLKGSIIFYRLDFFPEEKGASENERF